MKMTKTQKKLINEISKMIYESAWGGTTVEDFHYCYKEFKSGKSGWIKEHNSFVTAINVYNLLNKNWIVF